MTKKYWTTGIWHCGKWKEVTFQITGSFQGNGLGIRVSDIEHVLIRAMNHFSKFPGGKFRYEMANGCSIKIDCPSFVVAVPASIVKQIREASYGS